jgi:hypothetical protein
VRAEIAFGEDIIDIADEAENDWTETANGSKGCVSSTPRSCPR